MLLRVFGINHRTAPIDIREKMAFNESQLSTALRTLTTDYAIAEAVILSTCNRSEIYTYAENALDLQRWLFSRNLTPDYIHQYFYCYEKNDAVKHLMRVASGLDSMVLGEPQITGQIKQAYFMAQNAGTTGAFFNQLFPTLFSTSKHIRTHTGIGSNPVSLAYTITQLLKEKNALSPSFKILLIGAGEIIHLLATHLHNKGVKNLVIANRTLEKSIPIAESLQARAIHIKDIPAYLKDSDCVVSATASQLPIIGKGMIENTLKYRQNKPLYLIDLAVPRDIEPEIKTLNSVQLFNIDDLQTIIASNLENRLEAAKLAEAMIDMQASLFMEKMRVFNVRHIISEYRQRLEKIRMCEHAKAQHQLQLGQDPIAVLEQFGHQLINKILHHPTVKLKEAASEAECQVFQQIKQFFEL